MLELYSTCPLSNLISRQGIKSLRVFLEDVWVNLAVPLSTIGSLNELFSFGLLILRSSALSTLSMIVNKTLSGTIIEQ